MADIVDLAEAVKDALNAGTFSQPFTAVRHYLPRFDLAQMSTLHVSVVPRAVAGKAVDRSRSRRDFRSPTAHVDDPVRSGRRPVFRTTAAKVPSEHRGKRDP